ncbi:MAG: DUF934 domain-containing protein [Steroidobacteraceae bacterium]
MRFILRRREIVPDDWHEFGANAPAGAALIVPLAQLRADPQRWQAWPGRLGVRVSADTSWEDLADELPRLSLVAVEFPNSGDGRGYSLGRLLRDAAGFRGELRAVGAGVRQDQVFLMSRCGFDSLQLAAGEDPEAARRALQRYDVAYQPGSQAASSLVTIRAQRYLR